MPFYIFNLKLHKVYSKSTILATTCDSNNSKYVLIYSDTSLFIC